MRTRASRHTRAKRALRPRSYATSFPSANTRAAKWPPIPPTAQAWRVLPPRSERAPIAPDYFLIPKHAAAAAAAIMRRTHPQRRLLLFPAKARINGPQRFHRAPNSRKPEISTSSRTKRSPQCYLTTLPKCTHVISGRLVNIALSVFRTNIAPNTKILANEGSD